VPGPRIFLSAGEPSGDLHGGEVAEALKRIWPDASLVGLGGARMAEAGVELLAHVDDLAVMGFTEVVGRVPYFLGLLRRLKSHMREVRPDLVIPIDYPGFNFRLCRQAKADGLRILYYIAPQVWAWRRHRARILAGLVNHLAVILPFEEPIFARQGAKVSFVGHPLLDTEPPAGTRQAFCAQVGLDPDRPVLALFPGSRKQEVERHLRIFVEAADEVIRYVPATQPVIAEGSAIPGSHYASTSFARTRNAWGLLHHAEAAIVKSGTSTLQAALAATPMVVAYRMSRLSFALARRLVRVPHVGLVNLVAGERIVPELLQDEATPAALCDAVLPFVDPAHPARGRALADLGRVRERLRAPDGGRAADRVAALAADLIDGG
jgi:lipid-A-disaccharide synthase